MAHPTCLIFQQALDYDCSFRVNFTVIKDDSSDILLVEVNALEYGSY